MSTSFNVNVNHVLLFDFHHQQNILMFVQKRNLSTNNYPACMVCYNTGKRKQQKKDNGFTCKYSTINKHFWGELFFKHITISLCI